MGNILDGKLVSNQIKENLAIKCKKLKETRLIVPKLAIVIVGIDPASMVYVASKERSCAQVGIDSLTLRLSENISQSELESVVEKLAIDNEINGIMVQLPLPKGLNEKSVLACIPSEKDVDGLTIRSGGACFYSAKGFTPCTPKGIMEILKAYNVKFQGKHAVVVGRSNMVGKPIAMKLLEENATVTLCHSKTKDLAYFTKQADILVVAVGKKHIITADMVKPNSVVVDVGINRVDGKLCGDVDFENVIDKVSLITPVPGGIGLMTVTMLLSNTFNACLEQNGISDEF